MNQEETNQLYGQVGLIVAMSQMVEYNLAEIQAYGNALSNLVEKITLDEEKKKILERADELYKNGLTQTLGWNISKIKEVGIFDDAPELLNKLDLALKERNYIVHQLFKDDVRKEKIQKHIEQVLDRLDNDLGMLNNLNDFLMKILSSLVNQLSNKLKA